MDTTNNRPINILSINGGSNGLPALCMLEEMFSRLRYDLKSEKELCPCDYFEVIGGTGTGALVALLLGRMKMTVTQAIEAYVKLVPALLSPPAKSRRQRKKNSAAFEDAFRKVLIAANFTADTPLLNEGGSKTLIYALNTTSMSTPYILRSYHARSSQPPPLTVLQAACASVASQDKFCPVTIGEGHKQVTLVDATTGYSNPAMEILREAKEVFGGETKVATILSLGTTTKAVRLNPIKASESSENDILQQILGNCERVHHEVHRRLGESAIYHRFTIDIEPGLAPNEVSGQISSYLQQDATSLAFDLAIRNIRRRVAGPNLNDINSVMPIEIVLKPRPSLVRDFVGREDILHAMRQTHFGNRTGDISVPSISALTGLGGSGKTQIALKFALEYENQQSNAPVYFIDGSKETTLKTDLETILRSQGPNHRSASHEDALIWLATKSKKWLLIIDNVDDPSVKLSSFIPRCSHGHIVITTRDATRKTLAPDSTHTIEGLSAADAVILLLKSSNYKSNPSNQTHAKAIVEELGHLPLALAHAAAYISIHQCLSTFLSTYRQSRAQLLESKPDLVQGYSHSVAATIQVSLAQLLPATRDLLRIFAHLDARSIAYSVLVKAAKRKFRHVEGTDEDDLQPVIVEQANILTNIFCPGQEWVPAAFDEIISTCLRYSLLRVATRNEERFYSMHILVQSHLQENAGSVNGHTFPRLIVRLLGSAVITSNYMHDHLVFQRLLFPHIRLINMENVIEPGDHYSFGVVLSEMNDGKVAIAHLERCVTKWKQWKGDNDLNTLAAMVLLSSLHAKAGWEKRALETHERVLEIFTNWGDGHPGTNVGKFNLANFYSMEGQEQQALELRELILEKYRCLLGDEHRHTLQAMYALADSYLAAGRHQEALELKKTVLEKHRGLLGDGHRDTLNTMHNLANSYSEVGREQEALELRETLLEKRRGLLGEKHRDTLDAMHDLACSYSAVGRHQEALSMERLLLETLGDMRGKEHDGILETMHNIALTCLGLQKIAKLEEQLPNALPFMKITADEALTNDVDSTSEMQSNRKRKQTSRDSRGSKKRRK